MDHSSVRNLLAFVAGFFLAVWAGLAWSATPQTWYRVSSNNAGVSALQTSATNTCPQTAEGRRLLTGSKTPGEAAAKMLGCLASSVDAGTVTYSNPHDPEAFNGGASWRVFYDCTIDSSGSACASAPSSWYVGGNITTYSACYDGSLPVDGVCPEDPACQPFNGVTRSLTGPGPLPTGSVCFEGCNYAMGSVGIYLPLHNASQGGSFFGSGTGDGTSCNVDTPGLSAPQPLAEPILDPVPTTTESTDDSAPVTDGSTTTETTTEETTTTEKGVTKVTATEVEQIKFGEHGITRTTTRTTTTHPDGSTTTTTTTEYTETTPSKETTKIPANGQATTNYTPGRTLTGTTTTTTNTGTDGSSSTNTSHSGVGGDGRSGPTAGDGGDGTGEDGDGDGCGDYVPQTICDWFEEPQLPESPDLPEFETEPGTFSSGLGSGACPGNVGVSLGQWGSHSISLQPACDFASLIRPLVIAMAYLVGAFIVLGGRGR